MARGGPRVGNPRRKPAGPSPKVFPSEVAPANGKLWRWDTKAIIAHGAQARGQDVSEIAAHKLDARQSEHLAAVLMGTVFPAEGDGLVGDGE